MTAIPTVLPGQQVRITGGRFAGVETTPTEIQSSGWLKFHTNARRGYGVQLQNVAPGNWEPVPYAVGLHDFNPTSGGAICVTPVLLPDGTVTACMEPVKGAIHDPQAYAAYYAELTGELAKWAAEPVDLSDLDDGGRAARAMGIDMPKPLRPKMKRALELVCAGRGHAADPRSLAALVRRNLITEAQYRSDHRLTEAGRRIVAGEV